MLDIIWLLLAAVVLAVLASPILMLVLWSRVSDLESNKRLRETSLTDLWERISGLGNDIRGLREILQVLAGEVKALKERPWTAEAEVQERKPVAVAASVPSEAAEKTIALDEAQTPPVAPIQSSEPAHADTGAIDLDSLLAQAAADERDKKAAQPAMVEKHWQGQREQSHREDSLVQAQAVQAAQATQATATQAAQQPTESSPSSRYLSFPGYQNFPSAAETPQARKLTPRVPPPPSFAERAIVAAKNWLFGGNTVLRVGILLLFTGLAFLLRYASERISLPVEFRYAGVAAMALALLAAGWRLRLKNTVYGLTLQGTGIAVLYLTVFAAMYLHHLLPDSMAFVLLVLFIAAATVLAVLQDAVALAAAAALGGFATPVLISSGGGDHVALFSYFALLNAGILLVAWFKAWRILNLIGFVGTFGIGFAWGIRGYTPEKFVTTEPFLALFFLMFVCIGLLFARRRLMEADNAPEEGERHAMLRWSAKRADYLDGTLMFGPPLVGFAMQYAIIEPFYLGSAFSALGLGVFYFALAYILRGKPRVSLLMEVCLALSVIFATLATPLAFDDAGIVSAIWAVEGAGVYWLGLTQRRQLARVFALLLIAASALDYLADTGTGVATLLANSPLGAALLGVALLFCQHILRKAPEDALTSMDRASLPALTVTGLAFLYLIAPLCFAYENTVIAWALAGLATIFVACRLGSRAFLASAFGIETLGGLLFLCHIQTGTENILDSGWIGMMCASMLGFSLIASAILARASGIANRYSGLAQPLSLGLLAGLVFVNFALAFVFDWKGIGVGWAASGLLLIWLGMWQQQVIVLRFGVALEALAGVSFLYAVGGRFPPSGDWTSAVLTFAAVVGAWRLRHAAQEEPAQSERSYSFTVAPWRIDLLSTLLLAWGLNWWLWTLINQVRAFTAPYGETYLEVLLYAGRWHLFLLLLTFSAGLWTIIARRTRWWALAFAACGLPLALGLWVLAEAGPGPITRELPTSTIFFGLPVWMLLFLGHFLSLRSLAELMPEKILRYAHVAGAWLMIGVITLFARDAVALVDLADAWSWLAWAVAPSVYLWLAGSERERFYSRIWPFADFAHEYRFIVALPVMLSMLAWFWIANAFSTGDPAPLPYLPLANPLELGLLVTLFACWRWSQARLPEAVKAGALVAVGASFLAFATLSVCRAAYAWGGVPFRMSDMIASMGVQASWSLLWSLFSLALMISGSRRNSRRVWMIGAILMAVVVGKLFFVELGDQGGLARIISFIGVGLLLLVVGYFSPLPPKAKAD